MLWSVIKISVFVAAMAALALGAGWLMETDGGVRVAMAGVEFNLRPLQAAIALAALIVALWSLLKLASLGVAVLRFLSGDETAISRWFSRNRERKGYEALTESLMALASGEGRQALTKAQRAEGYLRRPELTTLISAQAAQMAGDKDKAEAAFKKLLQDERTRFVGIRGLMLQRLAAGDEDTALKLAQKAFELKPKHEETQDILLRLQAEHGDWKGARATLGAKLRHGGLPRDVYRRRDAVLALSEAKDVIAEGVSIEAREAAIAANKASPDLIPAAVMAAQAYTADGRPKYATRVLKKAWEAMPHPDLAAAFADIAPDETPRDRLKRFEALTGVRTDDPETKVLKAELLIAAEDFPAARRALGDLATTDPTTRSLTIMAAIERGEGADDAVVRAWLARAISASRGSQWVCDNCGTVHGHWMPVCSNCHAFDTLAWHRPAQAEVVAPTSTGMLPMIVGSPAGVSGGTTESPAGATASGPATTNVLPMPTARPAAN